MGDLLDVHLGQIEDEQMHSLLADLEEVCRVPRGDFESMSIWFYLIQCVYPRGREHDRQRIDGEFLPHESVLDSVLGEIAGSPVYELCDSLLRRKKSSAEFWHEATVADVLNDAIPSYARPASAEADAADADVIRQRRLNR